ncbi:HlyD family efflux transporter periplasmic adaptor subunit [Fischerella sp. PCC 9605]|uniref:HlyD family efflux transporter periplasmic adaptor subunit n=1 Tax=Fischerella sp. PCC 9605 TaxID=1173024 RepID=UPI00047DCCE4|nr:HlyD family efflux transporter periplasmic adaptor subunit [Fischerella sp. PCC 9605]
MNIQYRFDQPVLLQQTPLWSRAIAWGIIGITAFTLIWASVFKIDVAIPASGKLEPQGKVTDIQAPIGGVIRQIHVKEGQLVKKGQVLISLEETTTQAEINSLQQNRKALVQENEFYRSQLTRITSANTTPRAAVKLKIPLEIATLTQNRAQFLAENLLYRAQLRGSAVGVPLTLEQQLRLRSRQSDFSSQLAAAQLEIEQTQQQLLQNEAQLINAKKVLKINKNILNNLDSLAKEGAYSKLQTLKQEQDVLTQEAEVIKLTKEEQRLKLVIAQKKQEISKIAAESQEEILSQITANEKSIAEIDSQLTKVIVENQKKIHEIDSQLSKAQANLKYQKITAPIDGTVFELKPNTPGFVANSSEPILKIVPNDFLIAKIYITNKDIGFAKENYKQSECANYKQQNNQCPQVDIRIDSYPFQEYGDIKGKLTSIGSDALPPDEINPYWRFPAKVSLEKQAMTLRRGGELPLQSGMSISANIKLRQRTIISIFTDFVLKKAESLKFLR